MPSTRNFVILIIVVDKVSLIYISRSLYYAETLFKLFRPISLISSKICTYVSLNISQRILSLIRLAENRQKAIMIGFKLTSCRLLSGKLLIKRKSFPVSDLKRPFECWNKFTKDQLKEPLYVVRVIVPSIVNVLYVSSYPRRTEFHGKGHCSFTRCLYEANDVVKSILLVDEVATARRELLSSQLAMVSVQFAIHWNGQTSK